jgi:hypothetical protein
MTTTFDTTQIKSTLAELGVFPDILPYSTELQVRIHLLFLSYTC